MSSGIISTQHIQGWSWMQVVTLHLPNLLWVGDACE